jgi:hypothetical protein
MGELVVPPVNKLENFEIALMMGNRCTSGHLTNLAKDTFTEALKSHFA